LFLFRLADDDLAFRRSFLSPKRSSTDSSFCTSIFQTFKSFPILSKAITTIDLVETSPVMKAMQQDALEKVGLPDGVEVRWFDWIESVPKGEPKLFLSQSLFLLAKESSLDSSSLKQKKTKTDASLVFPFSPTQIPQPSLSS